MVFDLAELVRAALLDLGCDPALMSNFDSHSTIALNFNELPTINIAQQDEQVWLWCRLSEFSEAVLAHRAFELLSELMKPDASFLGGHASLGEDQGDLQLKTLVEPSFLENGERFGKTISAFFDLMVSLTEKLQG